MTAADALLMGGVMDAPIGQETSLFKGVSLAPADPSENLSQELLNLQ